jgi:hypothetical protein
VPETVCPWLTRPRHLAVTNALSGLVGVGGLFVMGGGLIPETFPQWLGAASVFLANLSKLSHDWGCRRYVLTEWQTSLAAS